MEQGPIKILGVTCSPEVFNIWDINRQKKEEKITNIRSKRKLLEEPLLSHFTHLFISLPNPPNDLLKRLDKIFYKFIWNSGPDKLLCNNMIRNEEGGLRIIKTTVVLSHDTAYLAFHYSLSMYLLM